MYSIPKRAVILDEHKEMHAAGFQIFSLAGYRCNIYAGTITDPQTVVDSFLLDMSSLSPSFIGKKAGGKYACAVFTFGPGNMNFYEFPAEYLKYTEGVTV